MTVALLCTNTLGFFDSRTLAFYFTLQNPKMCVNLWRLSCRNKMCKFEEFSWATKCSATFQNPLEKSCVTLTSMVGGRNYTLSPHYSICLRLMAAWKKKGSVCSRKLRRRKNNLAKVRRFVPPVLRPRLPWNEWQTDNGAKTLVLRSGSLLTPSDNRLSPSPKWIFLNLKT